MQIRDSGSKSTQPFNWANIQKEKQNAPQQREKL